jgi:symplekin
MAGPGASAAEMIPQLEAARKLALADPQVYTQVLPGILPIIGPAAPLEVRRWGADFIAEGFATPSLPSLQKEDLTPHVLPTLRSMLETPGEDSMVVKSVIQACASIYPFVFRTVYVNIIDDSFSPLVFVLAVRSLPTVKSIFLPCCSFFYILVFLELHV